VSPAQEHVVGPQWWTDYQPVLYSLTSKCGNRTEFENLVETCHAAGVGVIADTAGFILQVRKPTSLRCGVWVLNALMPCCSLLPPWSLPNGLVRCCSASVRPTCRHHPYRLRRCRKFFRRSSEELLKFQAKQYEFVQQQINLYSHYLKHDPRQGEILYNKEKASSVELQA